MNNNKSIFSYLKYFSEFIAGIALVVIVTLLTTQCIGRYVFRHTFTFVDDVVVCCFAWLAFAGAAAAYRRKMHYGLEFLINALPEKVKPVYSIVLQVIVTFLLAYLTILACRLAAVSGSKILYTTGISYKVIYAAIIYSLGVMTIESIVFVVRDIMALRRKTNQEVEE